MTIYLHLVTVSHYPPGITDLPGCAHDGRAMLDFWREYADLNGVELVTDPLHDERATRANVLAGFEAFTAAGPDDVCVFYYSGHGAQMDAPPELVHDAASRQCQTMVLHDSRLPGGQDLVDKELSYLLATRARNAGRVLVIADSCHSGTISRLATAVPRTVAPARAIRFEQLTGHADYADNGRYRTPPHRDHVTLSACQPEQVAVEMPVGGVPRGLFTYYLLETLSGARISDLSYAELADRTRTRVKSHYRQQDIHVMASGASSLDERFLGGRLQRSRAYLLHRGKDGGRWFFNQGSVQGIRAGTQVRCLVDGSEETCTVSKVLAGRATVDPEAWMSGAADEYPIVGVERAETPLALYLRPENRLLVRANFPVTLEDGDYPVYLVDDPDQAKYHLTELDDYGFCLVLPGEDRPLFAGESTRTTGWEDRFLEKLTKVVRYEATLNLAPEERPLPLADAVTITLEQVLFDAEGHETSSVPLPTDGSAVLDYVEEDGQWYPPDLRLRITRREDYPVDLWAGGLFLDEAFGVTTKLLPVKALKESESDLTTEYSGQEEDGTQFYQDYLTVAIDEKLAALGVTEIENHFKVVVSETAFDLAGHEQEPLEAAEKIDPNRSRKVVRRRRGQRHDRWAAQTVSFRVRKPLVVDDGAEMTGVMEVADAPEGLAWGGTRLHSSLSLSRTLHPAAAPPCPTLGYALEPAGMLGTRDPGAPKDVLELTNVRNAAAVTASNPLRLRAPALVGDGCLALAYDETARRYYPVGYPDADNGTMVIQQLPDPVGTEADGMITQKSLTGSVKLFFRKVVNDYLPGEPLPVNLLRKVEITPDYAVNYLQPDDLAAEVAAATRPIALFVHGIIGDTTVAPAVLARARRADGTPLLDHYGLVLTYDYENLNTELPKTAEDLAQQLAALGLGPGHDKTLHVFAHSMGGLVSRYFIERKRGHEVVSRLFQFGTPNGGSPFGTVAEYLTPLLTWSLGAGAAYHPLLKPLLALRWLAPKLLVTLQQMKTGSDFLKDLKNDGQRHGVEYTLINGDIHLIPDPTPGESNANFLARIMARFDWRDAVSLALFRGPTDVAVAVDSQRDVPGVEVRDPVGCDHLSYFTDAAAIKLLEQLW